MNDDKSKNVSNPLAEIEEQLSMPVDRRTVMKRVGRFAAYTGPALLVLLGTQNTSFGYP